MDVSLNGIVLQALPEEIPHFLENGLLVRGIFRGKRFAQLFEKPALFTCELFGHLDVEMNVHISASPAVQVRHSEISQAELRSRLSTFRDADLLRTVEGLDLDFGAEHRLRNVDRQSAMQIGFAPLEDRMILHLHDDI